MPLTLKSGFLTSSGEEGRLLMDSGAGMVVVEISHHALEAIADPPRADEFRLQQYIETFSRIASEKFDAKQFEPAGRLRVTSRDVRMRHTA